jgi:hypothetical protein
MQPPPLYGLLPSRAVQLKTQAADRFRKERFRIGTHLIQIREYGGFRRGPLAAARFVLFDREVFNFTYDIENPDEMGAVLDEAMGVPAGTSLGFILELESDDALRGQLNERLRGRRDRNNWARYGRRAGWYALCRIRRPQIVLETGTADGLGTALLLRAVQRNSEEGSSGRVISFDIRDDVGWLVRDSSLAERLELQIGDGKVLLPEIVSRQPIDMFIHDSDHSYEHQTFEMETVFPHCTAGAVVISDDAHGESAFFDFCRNHGLPWWVAWEKPRRHPYPGAAIGLTIAPEH